MVSPRAASSLPRRHNVFDHFPRGLARRVAPHTSPPERPRAPCARRSRGSPANRSPLLLHFFRQNLGGAHGPPIPPRVHGRRSPSTLKRSAFSPIEHGRRTHACNRSPTAAQLETPPARPPGVAATVCGLTHPLEPNPPSPKASRCVHPGAWLGCRCRVLRELGRSAHFDRDRHRKGGLSDGALQQEVGPDVGGRAARRRARRRLHGVRRRWRWRRLQRDRNRERGCDGKCRVTHRRETREEKP